VLEPGLRDAWDPAIASYSFVDTLAEPIRFPEGRSIGIKRYLARRKFALARNLAEDLDGFHCARQM
jgi:hypothetical protein